MTGGAAERKRLRLTVVIATYARPAGLRAALGSLQRQTRPPDEVMVVAWVGDAPSLAVAHELAGDGNAQPASKRVLLTVGENTLSAKENAGIQQATGDVVCFMDDDAVAPLDWLERLECRYAEPSVGAVGGRDVVRMNGQLVERPVREVGRVYWFGRLVGNHHDRAVGIRDVDFLKGCNMSFRREALMPIDPHLVGSNIPYGWEIDLGLTARERGYRIIYDPNMQVDHYPSTDYSAQNTALSRIVNHNQTYVLLKHLPWHRKVAFLLYTFLIGDKTTIGLLRIPWLIGRRRWTPDAIKTHLVGKVTGVRTYIDSLREGPRC